MKILITMYETFFSSILYFKTSGDSDLFPLSPLLNKFQVMIDLPLPIEYLIPRSIYETFSISNSPFFLKLGVNPEYVVILLVIDFLISFTLSFSLV